MIEKDCLTIDATSVGNEAELIELVHKVLQGIINDVEEL